MLDARLLLAHVINADHVYIVSHGEEALSYNQERQYRLFIERAEGKEPIPYIIGRAPFYGQEFVVGPPVLIPRPETERLVEAALEWATVNDVLRAADIGTGSGCIAITLAGHLPQANITAVDISNDALSIARQNAAESAVANRICFRQGSLLDPLKAKQELIVANLPYVADHEWTTLDDGIKSFEPDIALRGGHDGLTLINKLLQQATKVLAPGGAVFLEIGWQQSAATIQLAHNHFSDPDVVVIPDLAGHDRIVSIKTAAG
jgi:release factor glutamine methyltransferase